MSYYSTYIKYPNVREYIKKHINKELYEFEDFLYVYKKYKWFIFKRKKRIGQIYSLIYNIGNDYMVESDDKEFLDHIKPICDEYIKLTNKSCDFKYRLNLFKELE